MFPVAADWLSAADYQYGWNYASTAL